MDVEKMKANKDVDGLIKALKNGNNNIRTNAAYALGDIGDKRAVKALIEALEDENRDVRISTAISLGQIGDSLASKPLVEMLKDRNLRIRRIATVAIVNIGEIAVESLIKALNDEDWHVRYYAAEALGKIGDKRAVEPLEKTLRDEVKKVQSSTKKALKRIKIKATNIKSADSEPATSNEVKIDIDKLKANKDIEGLIEALKSYVSYDAVSTLIEMGKPAVEPLIKALRDKNWRTRYYVAEALGKIKDSRAIGPLKKILGDKNKNVQKNAKKAIKRIISEKVGDYLSANPTANYLKAFGVISFIIAIITFIFIIRVFNIPPVEEPPSIPEEIPYDLFISQSEKILSSSDYNLDTDEQEILLPYDEEIDIKINFPVRSSLIEVKQFQITEAMWSVLESKIIIDNKDEKLFYYKKESDELSWGDEITTSDIGDVAAFTPYVEANFSIDDKYHKKWVDATTELSIIYPVPYSSNFFNTGGTFINKTENLVRSFKIFVVSPDEYRTLEHILEQNKECQLYYDARSGLRVKIIVTSIFTLFGIILVSLGIRKFKTAESIILAEESAIDNLKNEDKNVRYHAADSLKTMDWKPKDNIEKAYYLIAKGEWDKLVKLGESAVEPLIEMLKDKDNNIRSDAAEALAEIGDKRAERPMANLLKDEEEYVRKSASKALKKIKSKKVLEMLKDFKKEDSDVQRIVIDSFIKTKKPAAKQLIELLKYKESDLKKNIVDAFWDIDESVIESLTKVLKDKDKNTRYYATRILDIMVWKPKDNIEKAYYLIAKGEWDELVRLGEPAVEPLIEALKDKDSYIRRYAVESLGEIGDSRAVEPLGESLKDKDSNTVRWFAAEALGKIGDKRAIKSLKEALNDKDSDVKRYVAISLEKIRKKNNK